MKVGGGDEDAVLAKNDGMADGTTDEQPTLRDSGSRCQSMPMQMPDAADGPQHHDRTMTIPSIEIVVLEGVVDDSHQPQE